MANDETLAALERAANAAEATYMASGRRLLTNDAALIRALIERERAGGEVAQIVAWLRNEECDGGSNLTITEAADAIEVGAHLAGPRVLSVNVVKREGE